MRRLTRFREREQGAIATIVAMLFFFGVMLALGALTVDVGNINADRRQLQNGADAAVLAAATACAKGACPNAEDPELAALVNQNAADGATKLARVDSGLDPEDVDLRAVCGDGPGLSACDSAAAPDTGNLQECPAAASARPSGAEGSVRVYTQTLDATRANTLLPYFFGAAITGVGSGANQQTCAAAAWGKASIKPLLPFTFSACEWYLDTGQDPLDPTKIPDYAPYPLQGETSTLTPPESDPMNSDWEHAIDLNSPAVSLCETWQSHDFPGGFGWLDYDPATCKIADPVAQYIPVGGVETLDGWWYPGNTGVAVSPNCGKKIEDAVGTVVYLPIFDCANINTQTWPCVTGLRPDGDNAWYHMTGAVAFFLTGVDITGQAKKFFDGYPTGHALAECSPDHGAKKCMYGWFLSDSVDPTAVIDGSAFDTGLKAIQMIG